MVLFDDSFLSSITQYAYLVRSQLIIHINELFLLKAVNIFSGLINQLIKKRRSVHMIVFTFSLLTRSDKQTCNVFLFH